MLEDIGLLKKQENTSNMEIPVSSTINSVTKQDDEVAPFFLNIARDFVKSGREIWEHRGLFHLLGRVAYCFQKWNGTALTKPVKQDHLRYLKQDLKNAA